jgi:hypothetical protein
MIMGRKNKKSSNGKKNVGEKINSIRLQIHPETERSILAIFFIGISAILILAGFHNAGPAGEFIYEILTGLFGLGYYLFPLIFLIMAGVFLSVKEQKDRKFGTIFIGATLFDRRALSRQRRIGRPLVRIPGGAFRLHGVNRNNHNRAHGVIASDS